MTALDYRLGYAAGYDVGRAHGVADEGAAWTSVLTGCTDTWRTPRQDEVEQARAVDHMPCPRRCARCSRCVHSLDYWRLGGRHYLGVEAEAELAAGAA